MKKLREFTGNADIGNDTAGGSRTSRSDEGVLALTNSVFQHVLGLNDETRSRMLKIIRNQGQWQDLKLSLRQLSGVAYRRLNDVINMAADANPSTAPEDEREGFNPQHEPNEYDHEGHGHTDRALKQEFEEYQEGKTSFAGFLLNELTYDEEDLRDPEQKQDIMRMMRASDDQAQQLAKKGNREQKQDQRQEITQEKDPQKSQLLRKKQTLLRQVAMIDAQLQGQNPNQAAATEDQY